MKRLFQLCGLTAMFLVFVATGASATAVMFEATGVNPASGQGLAASAYFEASGSEFILTLANLGDDVLVPSDVLTAVFFDLAGDLALSSQSAVLKDGSTVLFGTADPGGVVGGEWAYASGISGPGGATHGISSSGFGIFGDATFPGSNLQGPTGIDGLQYGITSLNDDPATGNAPVTGSNALIRNAVVFTLGGLPAGFDPFTSVSNVRFQYGTALTDPSIPNMPPVPEPASAALLAAGLAGFLAWRLRRRGIN